MTRLLATILMLLAPHLLFAQTVAVPDAKMAAVKADVKAGAKSRSGAHPSVSRAQIKSSANQMAAGIRAADAALTPGELAIAGQVLTGQLPCELGASVILEADPKVPGFFNLQGKGFRYRLHPVETSTGAIRLEDQDAGAVWLQLANKSMLMDQKLGRRLADECSSPTQLAAAEELRKNPAPSLIDMSTPAGCSKEKC